MLTLKFSVKDKCDHKNSWVNHFIMWKVIDLGIIGLKFKEVLQYKKVFSFTWDKWCKLLLKYRKSSLSCYRLTQSKEINQGTSSKMSLRIVLEFCMKFLKLAILTDDISRFSYSIDQKNKWSCMKQVRNESKNVH